MPSGGSPDAAAGGACESEAWKQQSRRSAQTGALRLDSTTDVATATARPPKLPPRWFMLAFWRSHRALHRLSGGRFLWTTSSKRGWGAARLTTVGRKSGKKRSVIIGYIEDGPNVVTLAMNGWGEGPPVVVDEPQGASGRRRSTA
jgi:hypothetical protein